MKNTFAYLTFMLGFSLITMVNIKAQKITGVIIDSLTQQPISDVTVFNIKDNVSTLCNENGEFEIAAKSLPAKILLSHISYKKVVIVAQNEQPLQIYLPIAPITLPEVKIGNPAWTILHSAVQKALSDTLTKYPCRAFYQKISKEGNDYTTIHEIFFDGLWGQLGLFNWFPTNARFAQKDDTRLQFQNSTTAVFYYSGSLTNTLIHPNSIRDVQNNIICKIGGYINENSENEIVEIICEPKIKEGYYFEGKIYIKTKNDNIVKIVGTIFQPSKSAKIKSDFQNFVLNFNQNSNGFSILSNMTLTRQINTVGLVGKTIVEKSKLIIYEYSDLINQKGMVSSLVNSDLALIKNMPYNPSFWQSNEISKRSEIEKKVILSFEKSKKFESNFIENKK